MIVSVAAALRENCRAYDVKARYGGDEFVVVMPDTRLEQGIAVAEKIRRAVASLAPPVGSDQPTRVTLSAGVTSTTPFEGVTPEELVRRADRALYEAKSAGRDRTLPWVLGQPAAQILVVDGSRSDAERLVQMCAALAAPTGSGPRPRPSRAPRRRATRCAHQPPARRLRRGRGDPRIRGASPPFHGARRRLARRELVPESLARSPVTLARKPVSIEHLRTLISESRVRR